MKSLRPIALTLALVLLSCGEASVTFDCAVGQVGPGCQADSDGDAVADVGDNCPDDANPDQLDADGNGIGDACQGQPQQPGDRDGDGIADAADNCPDFPNADQADADADGIGDACEGEPPPPDRDADTVPDAADNCPEVANADQADADADGIGDACEGEPPPPDADGDGVPDSADNCPEVANPGQADSDGDGQGDACEPPPPDRDGDGVPDSSDNCPDAPNPGQVDADGDGQGDACDAPDPDRDGDGVPDPRDNCPDQANPSQADFDQNGQGDACTAQDGTRAHPFIISPPSAHWVFSEQRSTAGAPSDVFDSYPPSTADESGPEVIYAFRVAQATRFSAEVSAPEPSGVDIDVHLLSSLQPLTLIARNNLAVSATLDPGVYYLSLDSYAGRVGAYVLDATFRPKAVPASETFNAYILKAVERINRDWRLLGYASAALTHALPYGSAGTIAPSAPPRTMCVAATMEVLLTAMDIYASETGDSSVFGFLPKRSWESLSGTNIRAHIWVNHDLGTWGTADAVRHFGLGQTVPFEELKPGSLINLNRTSGSGHAVVFLAFLDISGNEYETWNSNVIGFKYFSSQGGYDAGAGGFDYRWAVFSDYGTPTMPGRRDTGVILSADQRYLNTGIVYAPSKWLRTSWSDGSRARVPGREIESVFDPVYFDGVTTDD